MPARPGWRAPSHLKQELAALRTRAAADLGIDPVEPAPLARVRLSQLVMLAATFFGVWLLIQQFVGFGEISHVLADAASPRRASGPAIASPRAKSVNAA